MSEYCANCGAHLPGDAHFCPDCGHTVPGAPERATPPDAASHGPAPGPAPAQPGFASPPPFPPQEPTYQQPAPPPPPQPYVTPPPATGGQPTKSPTAQWIDDNQRLLVFGGLGLVIVILLGLVTFLALNDDDVDVASRDRSDQDDDRDRTTTSTSTTTSTLPPPTRPDTDEPLDPNAPPADVTPDDVTPDDVPPDEFDGWAYPEDAIGADLAASGVNYLGDCAGLDSTIDYGFDPYCSEYWGDPDPGLRLYRVASFPGGEFAVWYVLGENATGWAVINVIPDDGTGNPPI